MKLNLAIFSVLSLSSWWQQPLGERYGLRCKNRVMVSNSFVFKKTKSCRQHALLVLKACPNLVLLTKLCILKTLQI